MRLFLTSSISWVIENIATEIDTKGEKLVFITTATEGEPGKHSWQDEDRESLKAVGFEVFDYTLTDKTSEQVKDDLQDVDVIYVSGGNTFYLLDKVHKSGFAEIVREHVRNGKIYMSTSAGSQVVGPDIWPLRSAQGDERALVPNMKDFKGIGLVDVIIFPHWGSDHFRNKYLNHRLELNYTTEHKIILLTDYQYLEVKDDWYRIVEVEHE